MFKQVAELQSISKAAEKLGYGQPNVSQRMKGLEDELGVKLFTRNNRGITLTKEGSTLLEYTHQIILLMEEAKSFVNPRKWKETLTIGAPQTIAAVKIPQLLSAFLKEHQSIEVKARTSDRQKLQEMLSYGELDGAFISGTYNRSQFESVYSYTEKPVLISPKHHPLRKQHGQTLIVNSDTNCLYRKKVLDFSKDSNFYEPAILELDSLESILQAVHDGLGISIVPADVVHSRKELQALQSKELPETMNVDFIIKQRKQQPQSIKKFIRFLQR